MDTVDNSLQTFELQKRIIKASNIVEIIAVDIDLSAIAKCILRDIFILIIKFLYT
jgi:hypothetical protein